MLCNSYGKQAHSFIFVIDGTKFKINPFLYYLSILTIKV